VLHTNRVGGYHGPPPGRGTSRRALGPAAHSGLYFARRAGLVGVLTAVAVLAELLLVRVLVTAEFGHTVATGPLLAAMFAMTGVPLVTAGLHGLMTGAAATAPDRWSVWLRTPLAYLPVGLVLLLAAGLAAG